MHQLIAPLVGARERFAFAVAFVLARNTHALRDLRQHAGVDRISLCELAGGAGEIASAGWIDTGKTHTPRRKLL